MRVSLFIFTVFIALCTFACTHNEKVRNPAPETIKEFGDPSREIRVSVGEKFSIVLDSNATTGYSWQIAKKAVGPVVKFISRDYEAPRTKLAGAGGREHLTFRAESAGTEKLTFHYLRPWGKNTEPARTVTFTVVAK